MSRRRATPTIGATLRALAVLAGGVLAPTPVAAQGVGTAGAELLQMSAGTRASALGGAYTAAAGDPAGVFYNPASPAWLDRGVGFGYQAYVQDVTIGSLSGVIRAGPVSVAAGLLFLDAGEVTEIVRDPVFGGERGRETGETVGARETTGRVAAALPLANGRASAGVAVGFYSSDLAGAARSAMFVDAGAQLHVGDRLALGVALRNLGTGLASEEFGDAPLPSQARLGATYRLPISERYGVAAFLDGIWGIEEETTSVAVGAEGGFLPTDGAFSAVLRAGITAGESDEHLGRLRFGGGISLRGLAVDYTVQIFEHLGPIHRAGIRWTP